MRNKAGMKFDCIFEETLDFIDIDYTHLNKTIRYEQRPHGEWIEKTGMRPPEDKGVKFCSTCMNRQPRDFITHKPIEPDFCPNCGAKMRKEGEAE